MRLRKIFKRLIISCSLGIVLVITMSACHEKSKRKHEVGIIDPPPVKLEKTWLHFNPNKKEQNVYEKITVYLLDRHGYLAPVSLEQNRSQLQFLSRAERAVRWLIATRELADDLPPGFRPVLPEETKIKAIAENKKEKMISLNFAAPFPSIPPLRERKVIESLVWTLTELAGIQKVQLLLEGKPIVWLPFSGLPVDPILTRRLGINLEKTEGILPTKEMGVTLYFSSQTEKGFSYFVPITRLIERKRNVAQAALEQLIQGPKNLQVFKPSFTRSLHIEKLTRLADTLHVSLEDLDHPSSTLAPQTMTAMVLTLTEATDAPQVLFTVNGNDSYKNTKEYLSIDPFLRPAIINDFTK